MIPSSYRVVERQLPERPLLYIEDALCHFLEYQGYQEHLDGWVVFLNFSIHPPFPESLVSVSLSLVLVVVTFLTGVVVVVVTMLL